MEISTEQLQSFITLYKNGLGVTLTPAEAQQKALSLLRFLAISVTPLEKIEGSDTMKVPDSSDSTSILVPNGGQR